MLQACVIEFKGSQEIYLPLMEFAYNNSYQVSIEMALYGALYGRKYKTPVYYYKVDEQRLLGLKLVHDINKKIQIIRYRLKVAQNRQNSYLDIRRQELELGSMGN